MPRNGTLATVVREANLYANPDDSGEAASPTSSLAASWSSSNATANGSASSPTPTFPTPDSPIAPSSAAKTKPSPSPAGSLDKGIVDINTAARRLRSSSAPPTTWSSRPRSPIRHRTLPKKPACSTAASSSCIRSRPGWPKPCIAPPTFAGRCRRPTPPRLPSAHEKAKLPSRADG